MPDSSFGQLMGVIIIGGFILLALVDKLLANRRQERLHRERLAMIEKGLVPPPETDPRKWEAFVAGSAGPHIANEVTSEVRARMRRRMRRDHHPSDVARAFAVLLISGACGMAILLYFVGGMRAAAGVGGMMFCTGVGFLVLSFLGRRRDTSSEPPENY